MVVAPPTRSGVSIRVQRANGIDFELAEMAAQVGGEDRLVLCPHGIPELNMSWRHQPSPRKSASLGSGPIKSLAWAAID